MLIKKKNIIIWGSEKYINAETIFSFWYLQSEHNLGEEYLIQPMTNNVFIFTKFSRIALKYQCDSEQILRF